MLINADSTRIRAKSPQNYKKTVKYHYFFFCFLFKYSFFNIFDSCFNTIFVVFPIKRSFGRKYWLILRFQLTDCHSVFCVVFLNRASSLLFPNGRLFSSER